MVPGAGTDTYSYVGTSGSVDRIANVGGSGTTTDSIVDAGGDRLGVRLASTVNWFLPDIHGNIAASLDQAAGTIVNAIRYDAYGQVLATGGSGAVGAGLWKYQGRLDLAPGGTGSTTLYAAGARDYSPGLGTFTILDTIGGSAADPRSMNRFLYAEGNPATLVDPTGHKFCTVGNPDDCDALPQDPIQQQKVEQKWAEEDQKKKQEKKQQDAEDPIAVLPPAGKPASPETIGAMSIGQLQVYLADRSSQCGGLLGGAGVAAAAGCSDYLLAACLAGNAVGGSNDCGAYSTPTGWEGPMTDAIAALTAVGMARAIPAILQWEENHPDEADVLPQVVQNQIVGRAYQDAGTRWLQVVENFGKIPGTDRLGRAINVIPDSLTRGFIEFKSVLNLTDARGQISAMADAARNAPDGGLPLNIFVDPKIQSVSQTVITQVRSTGGNIWILDPAAGSITWYAGANPLAPVP